MSAKKKPAKTRPKEATTPKRPTKALTQASDLGALVERVVTLIEEARGRVLRTVNSEMVLSNWHIGREIVEYVQRGAKRAEHGEQVLEDLAAKLTERVGRGYSLRNLRNFRSFYLAYADRPPVILQEAAEFGRRHLPNPAAAEIRHTASAEFERPGFSGTLAWSHYLALSKVREPEARAFYEIEAERENWSRARRGPPRRSVAEEGGARNDRPRRAATRPNRAAARCPIGQFQGGCFGG